MAASTSSLWAIDSNFKIFWASAVDFTSSCTNTWTGVNKPQDSSEKIDQIRVSPTGKYVWLFSSQSGVSWARTEVSEANRQGKAWIQACSDVRLTELAVAENAVWCLATSTNELHRLRNLDLNNPAGLYWKPMRFQLKAISVDAVENRLWGLDLDNRIVRHEMQIYPPSCLAKKSSTKARLSPDYKVVKLSREEELERISPDPLQSWCLVEEVEASNSSEVDGESTLRELHYSEPMK